MNKSVEVSKHRSTYFFFSSRKELSANTRGNLLAPREPSSN